MLPKKHSPLSFTTHIVCAILFGVGMAYLIWGGISSVLANTSNVAVGAVSNVATGVVSKLTNFQLIKFENKENKIPLVATNTVKPRVLAYVETDSIAIPLEGKFVVANLGTMIITLYQDGQEVDNVPIETIGKKGLAWETPHGLYKIETKERTLFSSIGKVYMPFSMQFNGNYFIHGWTYYPDGTLVSAEFSGGCIKLKTSAAEKIFNFVSVGTPVYIYDSSDLAIKKPIGRYFLKTNTLPKVSAESYLVADLDTGEIILDKNRDSQFSIASITKLMTALVSLDVSYFLNPITIAANTLAETNTTKLISGRTAIIREILKPLLLESDNGAGEVLASTLGRKTFISKMNERAKSIGLSQTVFTDPSGVSLENISTASDLFSLLSNLYNYKKYIFDITKLETSTVAGVEWKNNNPFAVESGFIGGKSGINTRAKQAFANIFSLPIGQATTSQIAIIVLGSNDSIADTRELLNFVKTNVYYSESGKELLTASAALVLETKELATTSTAIVPEKTTTLAFAGDIMLDRGVKKIITTVGAGDYNFPFVNFGKIENADILFGNLEGPVSDGGRDLHNLYSFRMTPKVVEVLQNKGFDVLSVANNHMGDWTTAAYVDTINNFSDSNISLVGGGLSKSEAVEPKIIEKNGIKFGYIGFSDVGPNGMKAGTSSAGVLLASDPQAPQIIKQASEKCDVLVVSYHFGNEYEPTSNWRQRELAYMAIDNGARIVVGHHPHVVQEMENYRGGVIMYSLGNFIFDQYFSPETMSGLAVKITFVGKNISNIQKLKTTLDKNFRVTVE